MGGSLKISLSNGWFSIRYHLCMMTFLDSVLKGDILSRMVVFSCAFLFKNLCQIAYDDWMAETEHEITPAGRIKAPSRRSCVERILAAWESLQSDIIKKSFEVCAISLPIDGSEDENLLFSERRPTKQWEGGVY